MNNSIMLLLKSPFGLRSTFSFGFKIIRSRTQRKHLTRWIRSLQANYLLDAPSPWIVFDAIDFITARLPSQARVFEYGSGGSTLYWLSRGASCVSIEHDPHWYEMLRKRLPTTGSVDYRLVLPEKTALKSHDPTEPADYTSTDERLIGHSFQRYASQIDEFPDEHFDLILIDGRARPSCIMHSVRKVKRQGMLVLDNAERAYYLHKSRRFLGDFEATEFSGASPAVPTFGRTDVFVRRD